MLHTIGAKMNGITYIGFITIGKPNMIGSLMLNSPGTNDILQIEYSPLFFLPTINIAAIKPSVAPDPPPLPNASLIETQFTG